MDPLSSNVRIDPKSVMFSDKTNIISRNNQATKRNY